MRCVAYLHVGFPQFGFGNHHHNNNNNNINNNNKKYNKYKNDMNDTSLFVLLGEKSS